MSHRYDYRREYMNMSEKQLRETYEHLMNDWARTGSEDSLRRAAHVKNKIKRSAKTEGAK